MVDERHGWERIKFTHSSDGRNGSAAEDLLAFRGFGVGKGLAGYAVFAAR
jgi:hypothetical protein